MGYWLVRPSAPSLNRSRSLTTSSKVLATKESNGISPKSSIIRTAALISLLFNYGNETSATAVVISAAIWLEDL